MKKLHYFTVKEFDVIYNFINKIDNFFIFILSFKKKTLYTKGPCGIKIYIKNTKLKFKIYFK